MVGRSVFHISFSDVGMDVILLVLTVSFGGGGRETTSSVWESRDSSVKSCLKEVVGVRGLGLFV